MWWACLVVVAENNENFAIAGYDDLLIDSAEEEEAK